jgi:translation initiation factor IF-2
MRVHELAKELGLTSKDLLDRLAAMGSSAKQASNALDADTITRIKAALAVPIVADAKPAPRAEAPKTEAPKATAAPAAPVVPQPATPVPAAAVPAAPAAPAVLGATITGKTIFLKGPITVRDLATILAVRPNQLIAELMRLNILASINEHIDIKDCARISEKHGFKVEKEKKAEKPAPPPPVVVAPPTITVPVEPTTRPPIVAVLGHVDHGKTSLLDRIRNTDVVKSEAGGITQHTGASTVKVKGKGITFLDTPGHAAFTAMRARGARMTDIAIIVIDAVDGIMPQTQEAIKHAKAAGVQIMVAMNKVDLPAANIDRLKKQLAAIELTPEDWGGTTICTPISALTGQGVPELLDMILLQAEMMDLKANPANPAKGFVIEAQMESGMGPTANILVTDGTLRLGDVVMSGVQVGRVRALINDHGVKVKSAGPGTPVKCLGLPGVPEAGAGFEVCSNEKAARVVAEQRQADIKAAVLAPKRASLTSLFERLKETSEKVELRLLIKGDVQGSIEAIEQSLRQINSDKVSLNILLSDVGNISSNDVLLASASDAVIIGFHVSVDEAINRLAKQEGVEIRLHSIIYELIDQVREAMAGLLTPILKQKVTGHAKVLQVFHMSKGGTVAGCMITDGRVTPRYKVRVKRETSVLYEGSINSLRRFQNEASEVREGQECGIRLDNYAAFAEGDVLEFFEVERITQTL